MKDENFEMKEYLTKSNMYNARLIFQSKCKMMKTVKMNFKNHPKYMQENWSCSGCSLRDSQEHLLWCSGYAHLRVGLDIKSDDDLAKYYRNIIKLRDDDEN